MKDLTITRKETIRLRGYDYAQNSCYFVTIVVRDRRRSFLNRKLARQTIDCLLDLREQRGFRVFAYCLMPDHFHALIGPGESGLELGGIVGAFKSLSTRISWEWHEGRLWQRSYHDHVVRNYEDFGECLSYILENPVKAGLVEQRGDWTFSGRVDELG